MSPWASASPISTLVTARLLVHDAAELLGDAEHVDAQLGDLLEQLRRRRARGVRGARRGTQLLLGELAEGVCDHLLLLGRREVEQVALASRLEPRRLGPARRLECASGGAGRTETVTGGSVEEPLGRPADPQAVEALGPRDPPQRPQTQPHGAFGRAHLLTVPSRWITASSSPERTAKCLALRVAHGEGDLPRNVTRAPRAADRLAEADLDGVGVGQRCLERGEAAGLGPHAVRDRPREAERLGGQRVHVDRVAVAGDAA